MGYAALKNVLEHRQPSAALDSAVFEAQRAHAPQDRLLDRHALLILVHIDLRARGAAVAIGVVRRAVQVQSVPVVRPSPLGSFAALFRCSSMT